MLNNWKTYMARITWLQYFSLYMIHSIYVYTDGSLNGPYTLFLNILHVGLVAGCARKTDDEWSKQDTNIFLGSLFSIIAG